MISILESSPINAGGLRICFDKSPDIFKISKLKYSSSEHLGFFSENNLKGFASLGFYNALIQKREEQVFTFYNFFLKPEARGKRIVESGNEGILLQIFWESKLWYCCYNEG